MRDRDSAISESDLGPVDYWPPDVTCTRCAREVAYVTDTGLCESCEAAEDLAIELGGVNPERKDTV